MIYSTHSFGDLGTTVQKATQGLAKKADKFDAIIVRGTSGLLVGPSVAVALNKRLVVNRKPQDSSHSGHRLEGVYDLPHKARLVFLDDFRATGATEHAVEEALAEFYGAGTLQATLVGCYYYDSCYMPPTGNARAGWCALLSKKGL